MTSEKGTGDGSSGRSPPHREEQVPPPKSFGIRIENPDLLFKAVKDGISGEIGKHLLEKPIKNVSVELKPGKDTFNLWGEVSPDFYAQFNNRPICEEVVRAVAQRYLHNNLGGNITERGGNFIITAERGTKFVLCEKVAGLREIEISTGLVRARVGYEPMQILPPPVSTRESFDTVMADFIDVFKATVEEAYKAGGKTPPNEELVLHPPKISSNGIGEQGKGLSGSTETPDELSGKIEIEKSDVKFEDIGGQARAKDEIQGIAFALKNPELYKKWGTKSPKGVILHGPPGTGKTLMAKALASQADARFYHVQASDIVSKWYGDSEQIVRKLFERAAKNKEKTIIFFDEIDAIAPKREGAHEATQRIMSVLLEAMDGMASDSNVMVVASTNRLNHVDPAILRAGRFDRWVEVPLPDDKGRKHIFDIHMRKAEKIAGRKLFTDIDVDMLASVTDGYSGADIAEIIRRTLEEKVRLEGSMGFEPNLADTENILLELSYYEKIKNQNR